MSIESFFDDESEDGEILSIYQKWSREETISKLKRWDLLYHGEGDMPEVSDVVYDSIKEYAKKKWPKDKYFKEIGTTQKIKSKEIKHRYILGSLDKKKGDPNEGDYIGRWLESYHDNEEFVVSAKLDGLSIFSCYVDGKLELAATRGNGIIGRDITHKIIKIIPSINHNFGECEFRGEIILPGERYIDLGMANRRNGASGVIARDDSIGIDKLDVIIYEYINGPNLPKTEEDRLKLVSSVFGKDRIVQFEKKKKKDLSIEYLTKTLNLWREFYQNICDLDGLVITQNISERDNSKKPDNKIAYKGFDSIYVAEIKEIQWETSRTGRVVPTAIFKEAIEIDGAMIQRATAHNAKFVKDLGLFCGVKVDIKRSGSIIPVILGVHGK